MKNESSMKKNMMRRIGAAVLILALAASSAVGLSGCGKKTGEETGKEDTPKQETLTLSAPINVATLNGPTGIGMVKLMDMADKYNITAFQSPTDITVKVISGEVDIAAVPSNLAGVLFNKTDGQIKAISPITLGVLYILGNDSDVKTVADLKGKTIVASGQGGTPEYVLQKILENAGLKLGTDVEVQWLANHTEVNALLLKDPGTIAMIPEPFVSVAKASGGDKVSILLDMNKLWQDATNQPLPMGVLVARKEFVEQRENDLRVFLGDYKNSVDFVNNNIDEAAALVVEKGFIGKEPIAKAAIPNCNIVLYAGSSAEFTEGKSILDTFLKTLFEMDPKSIGGKVPGDDLYYLS